MLPAQLCSTVLPACSTYKDFSEQAKIKFTFPGIQPAETTFQPAETTFQPAESGHKVVSDWFLWFFSGLARLKVVSAGLGRLKVVTKWFQTVFFGFFPA